MTSEQMNITEAIAQVTAESERWAVQAIATAITDKSKNTECSTRDRWTHQETTFI